MPPLVARPDTQVLMRGFDPRLSVGSARPAVFRSSTYVFSSPEAAERAFAVALGKVEAEPDEDVELIYSRLSHPNAEILEDQLVPLEKEAGSAAVFNSGMAAISSMLLTWCRPGSQLIFTVPIYGGTHMLLYELVRDLGIEPIAVPAGDRQAMERAIAAADDLRLVFIETPANPTLRMTDIAHAVGEARKRKVPPLVAVDNTFLGPVFQHPLALGADICIYSATKYLAGFSDMLGGVAITTRPRAHPPPARHAHAARQHPPARRVLAARQPPGDGVAAHEQAEQERAAHRRGDPRPHERPLHPLPDCYSRTRSSSGSTPRSATTPAASSRSS